MYCSHIALCLPRKNDAEKAHSNFLQAASFLSSKNRKCNFNSKMQITSSFFCLLHHPSSLLWLVPQNTAISCDTVSHQCSFVFSSQNTLANFLMVHFYIGEFCAICNSPPTQSTRPGGSVIISWLSLSWTHDYRKGNFLSELDVVALPHSVQVWVKKKY